MAGRAFIRGEALSRAVLQLAVNARGIFQYSDGLTTTHSGQNRD
jgi:hypothetical protein